MKKLTQATVPGMIAAGAPATDPCGVTRTALRALHRAWFETHAVLGAMSDPCQRFTPDLVRRAVLNEQAALQWVEQARHLPRTSAGAKVRSLALSNASVALEALETIANHANSAPCLNGKGFRVA